MTQASGGNTINVRQAVPFFMVVNMHVALEFYTGGLGFELKQKWEPNGTIEWCWLQKDTAAIMLKEYRADVPQEKRGVGFCVCFMCDDALGIYKESLLHGLSPAEPFVGNNLWVVGFRDPDDYQVYFESPTDVPEETTYSEWVKVNG